MIHDVLLAEHDASLGHAVLRSLAKVHLRAEWVQSAAELRHWTSRARDRLPRLVLLDWELPGAAAGEALSVVEGFLPASRIVVLGERLTGDTAAVLLSRGVPSIQKPVNPFVLSMLALDLAAEMHLSPGDGAAEARDPPARGIERDAEARGEVCDRDGRDGRSPAAGELRQLGSVVRPSPSFENLVAAYASSRRLSRQQALILDLYLNGNSDKEIAQHCACSGATVYEHWRRMAKKSGGRQKSDLIADFHRYLRQTPAPSSQARMAHLEPSEQTEPLASPHVAAHERGGVRRAAPPPAFASDAGSAVAR